MLGEPMSKKKKLSGAVSGGSSKFVFGPDGKFIGLHLDKSYALKKRWSKVTRAKPNEDQWRHQFLIKQLELLGKQGNGPDHYRLILNDVSKIISQNRFSPETLLARYCVFVPILDSLREILTEADDEVSTKLLRRFSGRVQAARKLLSPKAADDPEIDPQQEFISTVRALAIEYNREPTMAEVGKALFPEKLDHERRIRVSQLVSQTGLKLPRGKPGPVS
jgi:hypothetical protein